MKVSGVASQFMQPVWTDGLQADRRIREEPEGLFLGIGIVDRNVNLQALLVRQFTYSE